MPEIYGLNFVLLRHSLGEGVSLRVDSQVCYETCLGVYLWYHVLYVFIMLIGQGQLLAVYKLTGLPSL